MMVAGLGAARRMYKKYGPIDYRKAAKTIQKAYREYKRKTGKKKFSANKRLKRGSFPRARIGTVMGVHGKKGKKPAPLKGVRRVLDKSLTSTQTDVNYVGFQQFGSAREVAFTLCLHIVKDIFARTGAPINSWQGAFKNHASLPTEHRNRLTSITFHFQSDKYYDVEYHNYTFTLAAYDTAEDLATDMEAQFRLQYSEGFYPLGYTLGNNEGEKFYSHETLGEDMVDFYATTYIKVHNITPADNDSTNINDVNANPLIGKIYDFKHPYIKMHEEYLREVEAQQITGTDDWTQVHNIQNTVSHSDRVDTQYLRNSGAANIWDGDLLDAFKKPPRGAAVFANLAGAKTLSMPPGGYQVVKRDIKVTCSVKRFIAGAYNVFNENSASSAIKPVIRPILNRVIMLGMEPAVRSETDEQLKLVVARKITHDLRIRRKKPTNVPVHVSLQDAVNIG
jgi:hypothetical protein